MVRSPRSEGTQSPPARDANQSNRAVPQPALATAQLPAPKAPATTERTRESGRPQPEPPPPQASTSPGQGSEAPAASQAPQAKATPASARPVSPPPTFPIPAEGLRHEVQELLVNMLAGNLLEETDTPIPRPRVVEVKQVEKVLVEPPQMDPETAQRLLTDGTTLESLGAYLFFNPAVRSELLSRRGK